MENFTVTSLLYLDARAKITYNLNDTVTFTNNKKMCMKTIGPLLRTA